MRGLPWLLLPWLVGCQSFRFEEDEATGRLHLFDGDRAVLSYCYGDQLAPGVPADRKRSSYVHPIHGLDGEILTEDFPADHHHHRGLSLMWPRMKVGAQGCELWHIKGIRSVFGRWLQRNAVDGIAVLAVRNHWTMDDGRRVCREDLRLEVHPENAVGRAIDVRYELTALDEPITVQGQVGRGYGGLNLRLLHATRRTDTVITTDEGKHPKDSDRRRFAWADMSARFGGHPDISGIAVFVEPKHAGFPPPWTLRYYGDLNVAWPGLEEYVLRPGEPLVLRYRLWVHRGDARVGDVNRAYEAFRDSNG